MTVDADEVAKPSADVADSAGMLSDLLPGRYISLTTYRRDGAAVATPVEFVVRDGAAYVRTDAASGKVKRLRRDAHVLVARCTMRGKVTGPMFAATATLLGPNDMDAVNRGLAAKYGWLWRLGVRLRRPKTQGIKIVPAASAQEGAP